jgi:predicted nucleotidyltransferase
MREHSFHDRDFLVTDSDVIFEVTEDQRVDGPVIAFPRYIPFDVIPIHMWGHTWRMRGREYSRFDLRVTTTSEIRETFDKFYRAYPQFAPSSTEAFGTASIPHDSIIEHVRPQRSLARLRALPTRDPLQAAACKFADACLRLGIPEDHLGVTNSLMFDGHTVGFSDVDFVIYGALQYRTVIDSLRSGYYQESIQFPTFEEWQQRYAGYEIKDMPLTPHVYALHKIRKYEESYFDGHKLSIFAVRSNEVPEVFPNKTRLGPLRISGQVVDASQGMFRPSIYKIQPDPETPNVLEGKSSIVTIVNDRREYISQVMDGERVSAFGLASVINESSVVLELGSLELRGQDFLVAEALQ